MDGTKNKYGAYSDMELRRMLERAINRQDEKAQDGIETELKKRGIEP